MDDFDATIQAAGHDELITITLEDSSTNFAVSKALLCKTSDYFKKALDGGFREAGTRQLRLPGCDKHTFNMFLYYLLKRELPDESISKMNDDGADLGRLWAFGDAYLMPKLQNLIMQRLITEFCNDRMEMSLIEVAYEQTADGSALRRAVLQEAVWDNMSPGDYSTCPDEMDTMGAIPGFMFDYVQAVRNFEDNRSVAPSQNPDPNEYMVEEAAGTTRS